MKFSQALIFTACVPISLVSAMRFSSHANPHQAEYFANKRTEPANAKGEVQRDIAGDELSHELTLTIQPPPTTDGTDADTEDVPSSKCRTMKVKCSECTLAVLKKMGACLVKTTALPGVLIAYLVCRGYLLCEICENKCIDDANRNRNKKIKKPDHCVDWEDKESRITRWLNVVNDNVWDGVRVGCKYAGIGVWNCIGGTFGCSRRNRLVWCLPDLCKGLMAARQEGFAKSARDLAKFKDDDTWCGWPFPGNCIKTGKVIGCTAFQLCRGINYFCCCCRAAKKPTEDGSSDGGLDIDADPLEDAVEILEGVMVIVELCKSRRR